MEKREIRLIALDLDGTLTRPRTPLEDANRALLDALAGKYRLVIAGAGTYRRISDQLNGYPIDIIGNYGMELAECDRENGSAALIESERVILEPREDILGRVAVLRRQFGMEAFSGESVLFHDTGVITVPMLGTEAKIADKLAFDPDRKRRAAMYSAVKEAFSAYTVYISGSSSFDIVPPPFDKLHALGRYCARHGIALDEILYFGDEYYEGGNDEPVYRSEIEFVKINDYRELPERVGEALQAAEGNGIRRFRDADAKEVSALIGETLLSSNSADYSDEELRELIARMTPDDIIARAARTHFYVACAAGRIVGCGAIGPWWDSEEESGFFSIFVLPAFQRRGIGRRIVQTLERDEFFLRAKRIEIPSSITAVEFYRKLGYDYKDGVKALDKDRLYRLEKIRG